MSDGDEELREQIQNDPFCDHLGITVVSLEAGKARTELTVSEELLNFHGNPHGGAIYSLADAAFAAASNATGESAVALETNMSYLEPVEVGETISATATRTHASDQTAEYEIQVTDHENSRIATFRGRVYKVG